MEQSPIFARTYDLIKWLIPLTVKFPRHQRFVLAAAMQQAALGLQERLIEAVRLPNRADLLRVADVELDKLRFYLRLSHDLGYISLGQQRHAGKMLAEIGRLLGSWQKNRRGIGLLRATRRSTAKGLDRRRCVAAPGAATLGTPASPTAPAFIPLSSTTSSGFGSWWPLFFCFLVPDCCLLASGCCRASRLAPVLAIWLQQSRSW